MRFYPEEEFNPDDYVKAERFPDGAAMLECRMCGRWLVVPTGEEADCGMHKN